MLYLGYLSFFPQTNLLLSIDSGYNPNPQTSLVYHCKNKNLLAEPFVKKNPIVDPIKISLKKRSQSFFHLQIHYLETF